jgi:hypothetical protein
MPEYKHQGYAQWLRYPERGLLRTCWENLKTRPWTQHITTLIPEQNTSCPAQWHVWSLESFWITLYICKELLYVSICYMLVSNYYMLVTNYKWGAHSINMAIHWPCLGNLHALHWFFLSQLHFYSEESSHFLGGCLTPPNSFFSKNTPNMHNITKRFELLYVTLSPFHC